MSQISVTPEELKQQAQALLDEAEIVRKQEITEVALASRVAKAAGVSAPLERTSSQERFSILLGSKALEEKLALLKQRDEEAGRPSKG